jgi:hypothetical protein
MKAQLIFDLTEEQEEFNNAVHANELVRAVRMYLAELRGILKYQLDCDKEAEIYERAKVMLLLQLESHGVEDLIR